ncbi:MAG: hypothetical protein K2N03_00275 [Muribaculaceae bacterium]|nr:hypothetical protein [Muribaculaceae bacterium]
MKVYSVNLKTIVFSSLLLIFLTCMSQNISASPKFSVTASLDSARLLMGYTTRLRLSVDQPKDLNVEFPLLKDNSGRSYISLLGDSIEISPNEVLDTTILSDKRIRVNYNLNVQAFDSGYYKLPEFLFKSGDEIVKSNSVDLTVLPVKVAEDAQISGFTGIEEPLPEGEEEDGDSGIKTFLKKYWWIVLCSLLLIPVIIWCIIKYRKEGTLLPVKPQIPPYDEARESLISLKSRKLWEIGREKEYYTQLTNILRKYLSREYNIPAMEMTSRQLMSALKGNDDLNSERSMLREMLDISDFVKYAKVRPLPEDNEKAFTTVEEFIGRAHSLFIKREELESDKSGNTTSVKSSLRNKKRDGFKLSKGKTRNRK